MIQPSKYNGINFSGDFNRTSEKYNFAAQRVKNILPLDVEIKFISFFSDNPLAENVFLKIIDKLGVQEIEPFESIEFTTGTTGFIHFFKIAANLLNNNLDTYFSVQIDTEVIYSEIYIPRYTSELNDMCKIIASNSDNRHGYLANQAFGFFKFSKLKSDIFLNKKTEYNYSYSRKKILSSENQVGKRFTFLDLTMYNANLLKWLCNCENLSIDGTSYQLISDFTELESDPNSEIISLQADFVEVNQSFFATGTSDVPTNIFTNQFFN